MIYLPKKLVVRRRSMVGGILEQGTTLPKPLALAQAGFR